MKVSENKTSFVKFLLEDWADETRFLNVISYKKNFVKVESKFFVLQVENSSVTCSENEELETEQEEANTSHQNWDKNVVQFYPLYKLSGETIIRVLSTTLESVKHISLWRHLMMSF